ncbi:MAG: hypothetical protein A2Y10_18185 [Planctomycetes bacterium GWF2_41_51]|nr:MAG: hypothetical protein A2Y10_18185 [Planctomycetes bacterium GWF2_41_51]HBG27520.1 hypothetical protein [Phycisphaerales bacterium]
MNKLLQATGRYLKTIGRLFWHNYCLCCNCETSEEDEYFCPDCWSKIGFCLVDSYCNRCGREISVFGKLPGGCAKCENESFYFDSIACAGIYKSPLRELILQFKLADKTRLLPILTDFIQKAIYRTDFYDIVDYIVPVPLHWRKRFQRGFNQSELIAKNLKISSMLFSNDIVKVRETPSQTAVSFEARRKNLEGAFAVRKGHNFDGKNVCLIDDVKTTGATLNECAKVLKEAGAGKVFGLVLAVAGQEKY